MPQMPDTFKPIDIPDSFQPITTPEQESPGILERAKGLWEDVNKPLINIRSGSLKEPSEQFAAEHPVLGTIGNFATDVVSSLTSPLNLGLTALTGGAATAEKLGASGIAKMLEVPAKVAAGGMVAEGGYNLVRPNASLPERAGGLLEAGMGGLGLRTPKAKLEVEPKVSELARPEIEVPKVNDPIDRILQKVHDDIPVDEKTGMKIYNPEGVRSLEVPGSQIPEVLPESQVKLRGALKESVPLNEKQREIYRVERAEKFGKAEDVNIQGEEDLGKFFGALKGAHTKVDITPLRSNLEQTDVDDLLRTIRRSSLSQPEQANAFNGLQNLLDGKVPTDYDIQQLGKVFGEDVFSTMPKPMTLRRVATELGSSTKSLKSSFDFGLPFRQGANYVGRKSWFESLIPMMKAYGSKRIFDEKMSFIRHDPFFETARDKMKIAFTDLGSALNNREETAVGKLVQDLPGVAHSNRAATMFSNQIRFNEAKRQYNAYKTAYESGMRLARTEEERQAAKLLNPDNPYVAAKLGDSINTATGRGKLPGNTEKIANELNSFLFSPRLMASRIRSINRVLNPVSYWKYNPLERSDARKQLASLALTGLGSLVTVKSAAQLAGYDSSIGTDPDSTDFMKLKINNTRYDPWGGYQQYFVPFFKAIMGTTRSTKDNEQRDLNKGPFAPTGVGTLERTFIDNKLSPLSSLGAAVINRHEVGGRETDFTSLNPFENTLTRSLANPIILQDVYDTINEDPTLSPLLLPDMFGQSVQVYEQR